ncbi:helix-turn-helix domain-containing protein [Allokutzneria sp. A3M-2-11 16]|uniref:helix-turn-helix domain-containing protein n=1 Tax=Allokutzneria sp. A3M-2-11 16 TaxID=2962043 RepID=UPI0020B8F4E3|nr:helix-turn-helix domain-containing protein [Allokutzneria sp. A3M-2-11 16]MCP3802357.1 helix-turn-helix domain-containing protein [Allokutzneria sp. A3M-2-11 16]
MAARETPYAPVRRLLTGHEHRRDVRCLRRRGTPVPLLIHTRTGRGTIKVAGQPTEQILSPGDTALWWAGTPQDFGPAVGAEPWEIVWAHFHPRDSWHEWLAWPALGSGVARIPAPQARLRARVDDMLLEMDSYARSALPRAVDLALNALERALLWLDSANPRPARLDAAVQEAILFIARNLDKPLTVPQIAAAAGLSPSRLAHVFKAQTGVPPAQFVEHRRVERAKTLLESSSLPIGAVSEATGFSSALYFATRFRKVTGLSPSGWRAQADLAAASTVG